MLGLTEQLAGGGSSGAGDSRGGGKARRGSRLSLQLATENVIVQNRDDAVVGDGIVDVVKMAQNRMKGATAKEVFQRIDKDGGGELDRRETRRALKELGIEPWSKCRHPGPLLAAPATLNAWLGACAAPRILQVCPSPLMVRPSARVKVADSTAFDHPGIDPDSKLVQRQIKKFDEDGALSEGL